MFYYFKTGVVFSRISYLDKQIIDINYNKTFRLKLLLEWCRHIHLDKSIKTKVAQMLKNTSTSLNASFINMTKIQIDEYFNDRINQSKEAITLELVNLKHERNHYKNFIKQELIYMKSKIEHKYPLKIKFDLSSILPFNWYKPNTKDDVFYSARELLSLSSSSPKTQVQAQTQISPAPIHPNFITQKHLIHKNLHNFQSSQNQNQSFWSNSHITSSSPNRNTRSSLSLRKSPKLSYKADANSSSKKNNNRKVAISSKMPNKSFPAPLPK